MSKSKKNEEVAVIETPVAAEKQPTKRQLFDVQKIRLLVDSNPKKNPSMAYDRFQGYFTLGEGATVADARRAGLRMDDFRHDVAHGFIQIGDEPVNGRPAVEGDL